MPEVTDNPLISTKPSDLDVTVSLHPLVLLTASDQITRHRVRGDKGPIGGILLGQQKGQEITAEHAFAAAFGKNESGQDVFMRAWLEERIQQYRDVHKAPALDVVGWFTLCSAAGPRPEFVPLQLQLNSINESAILLAIHPEAFEFTQAVNQKLPISLYESVLESETAAANANDESSMQVDGDELTDLKFRIIPYTVETDEAEMIAISYVAKGAGSAAAVAEQSHTKKVEVSTPPEHADTPKEGVSASPAPNRKGKKRATTPAQDQITDSKETNGDALDLDLPTPEEQDTISSIQTRLNSVKMLQSRIDLLQKFVTSLPPSYVTDPSIPLTVDSPSPSHLVHLRNIQALLTRLSLLTSPSEATATTNLNSIGTSSTGPAQTSLEAAAQAQANDVALAQLLSTMNHDVQALSELGKKFSVVDAARGSKKKGGVGAGMATGASAGPGAPGWAFHSMPLDDGDLRKLPFGTGSTLV
ncbi:hypothetical protein DV736_g2847, partial [Chaetothyriales sp. CBS 134916]